MKKTMKAKFRFLPSSFTPSPTLSQKARRFTFVLIAKRIGVKNFSPAYLLMAELIGGVLIVSQLGDGVIDGHGDGVAIAAGD
jgi:hypothetical protein